MSNVAPWEFQVRPFGRTLIENAMSRQGEYGEPENLIRYMRFKKQDLIPSSSV